MIRRGTGRTPPYILVGLVLVIAILGFNYWTLSSQNADLQQELEKMQSDIKISAMKHEQSEKKNAALQDTVHDMDNIVNSKKKEIDSGMEALRASRNEIQSLKYEITSLKSNAVKMEEKIASLNQQADECDLDLTKAKEVNNHLTTERDDAVEAIAEKDSMINTLKRQLEQVTVKRSQLTLSLATSNSELIRLKKECEEVQKASDSLADIIVQTKRDTQLEYEAKFASLKENLSEEKDKYSQLLFSADDLQKKLSQAMGDLTETQDKVSRLESTMTRLVNEKQKEKSKAESLARSVTGLTTELRKAKYELTTCLEHQTSSAKIYDDNLKKAQDEAAAARREKMAVAKPKIQPGMMNLPDIEHKEPYIGPGQLEYISRGAVHTKDLGVQGLQYHPEPILPRDPPNIPRKKARFSVADIAREVAEQQNGPPPNPDGAGVLAVPQPLHQDIPADDGAGQAVAGPGAVPVMERPAPPVVANNKPIQAPIHPEGVDGPGPQNDVLAPPPQHLQDEMEYDGVLPGYHDNLDAAIDEEEKIIEDAMDDQDEEGNEIKQNQDLNDRDNLHDERKPLLRNGGNVGGALEVPQPFHDDGFNHQDMNMEDDVGNQGNYYDANFENKIRNLGRPPDIH